MLSQSLRCRHFFFFFLSSFSAFFTTWVWSFVFVGGEVCYRHVTQHALTCFSYILCCFFLLSLMCLFFGCRIDSFVLDVSRIKETSNTLTLEFREMTQRIRFLKNPVVTNCPLPSYPATITNHLISGLTNRWHWPTVHRRTRLPVHRITGAFLCEKQLYLREEL
jgi:hypothetical protein